MIKTQQLPGGAYQEVQRNVVRAQLGKSHGGGGTSLGLEGWPGLPWVKVRKKEIQGERNSRSKR